MIEVSGHPEKYVPIPEVKELINGMGIGVTKAGVQERVKISSMLCLVMVSPSSHSSLKRFAFLWPFLQL